MQDISRQFGIALRWLPLILIVALAAGGVAYLWSSGMPTVYESSGRLEVVPGIDASLQDYAVTEAATTRYADQAESLTIARAVADDLRLDMSARSLQRRISTDATPELFELVISARDEDPQTARRIATNLGKQLRLKVQDTVITDEMKIVDDAIADALLEIRRAQNRVDTLRAKQPKDDQDWADIRDFNAQILALYDFIEGQRPGSKDSARNLVKWSEFPVVPEQPVEPRPLYWTLLALVAAGMAAVGLAFAVEYLRNHDKIRDEEDLEEVTGLMALGTVTETNRDIRAGGPSRLVVLRYPKSDAAEAFHGMLARIGFASGSARSLMVAGSDDSDSKSAVAANLALAYAMAGRNVILVDADFRSPSMHTFFGVRNDRGLTTVLTDPDVPLGWVTAATSHPRLGLMPAGPPPRENADPLGAPQLSALMRRLLHAADMVVFDSPSMTSNLDAAVLATHLSESVLVVSAGSTDRQAADAARVLHSADSDAVGVVLYKKARWARRGERSTLVPPPVGQGQQAPPRRIPVRVTRGGASASGAQADPATSATASPPAPTVPPPGAPGGGAANGPYTTPFEPDKATSDS